MPTPNSAASVLTQLMQGTSPGELIPELSTVPMHDLRLWGSTTMKEGSKTQLMENPLA